MRIRTSCLRRVVLWSAMGLCLLHRLPAQPTSPPKYELRGAWIATVINLDWPASQTAAPATQQQELVAMLDALRADGINAVFFQIRSECDAFYNSPFEPWSKYLTGTQGKAPVPAWDPLAFAIEQAHARGMELHAWFNPFRAERSIGSYPLAASHVKNQHPDWMLTVGTVSLLNPGIPAARDYITSIVLDVVRRYDLDGVHFDDYFYPYPPNTVSTQDETTFQTWNIGFSDINTWRRYNINQFVRQVGDSLRVVAPHVKYGISPFGIWKDGTPAGISGLSAFDVLYADAVNWLSQQWIDYLMPQLYWAFGGAQDYGSLAPWWQSVMNGRHLYVGHGLYRTDAATFTGTLFGTTEIPSQVRFNRTHGIPGSVFFRARNLTAYPSGGFSDTLQTDLFQTRALTPPMDWKDLSAPGTPETLQFAWTGTDEVRLAWTAPPAKHTVPARRYAVYRVRTSTPPDAATIVADPTHLLGVTGLTEWVDRPGIAPEPYHYLVTALSPNSIESAASNMVALEGRAVAVEPEARAGGISTVVYPNPFAAFTTIEVVLEQPVRVGSLKVVDALGRTIAVLATGPWVAGRQTFRWDAHTVASGTYFCVLDAGGYRQVQAMLRVR